MPFRNFIPLCIMLIIFFPILVGGLARAQEEEEDEPIVVERPSLRATVLSPEAKFNGVVYGDINWVASDSIANLTTIEPEEGGVPAAPTIVKVYTRSDVLVVLTHCYDREPDKIVSYSKARDAELEEEDHIILVLDTFLDGRSGYVFAVNPSGARFDGLVIERGEDVNSDWDAIWEAKTWIDEGGWHSEIRIPIKSLSFKKDLTTWGFNIQRRVQRLQETSRWSGARRDHEIFQTSRAGRLTGLPRFDFGAGLSIRPATVGRTGIANRGDPADYTGDMSLDITQRLGPNLLSALTINTDFAETEVDVRQINLTRFPLFFPEKRTFFLQGSDIFEFGAGLDEDTFIPFYSRRIGLVGRGEEDLKEVPINAGGKINGRVGNTNLGALIVNTRNVDSLDIGDVDENIKIHVPQTTVGALRISQNILEESSVGMLATFGDQLGRSKSWSLGADFTFRTSNFLNEKNFLISVWAILNHRRGLHGDKSAYGFRIDYPNDLLDLNLTSIRLGDGFDPSLGFIPRNNYHLWDFTTEFRPRPGWAWLRQMTHEFSLTLYNRRNNSTWESYESTLKIVDWLLESGDSFQAGTLFEGDRPPEAFEIATDTDIPSGSYTWNRYFVGARAAEKRKLSGEILWEFGDYYNGDLSTLEARLSIKPSSFLNLEFTAERNTGKALALPEDVEEEEAEALLPRNFTEELIGFRLLLNFSSDLQLSSLTQYDTQSKELGSNTRMRWTFDPLGDVFIVYNHNIIRRRDRKRWQFVSNELPVKIQYVFRF